MFRSLVTRLVRLVAVAFIFFESVDEPLFVAPQCHLHCSWSMNLVLVVIERFDVTNYICLVVAHLVVTHLYIYRSLISFALVFLGVEEVVVFFEVLAFKSSLDSSEFISSFGAVK